MVWNFLERTNDTHVIPLFNHGLTGKLVSMEQTSHTADWLDSEDDFQSGFQKVSLQQQFFWELPSPRWSHYTNICDLIWENVH